MSSRQNQQNARQLVAFVPYFQYLEPRCVPATFLVKNTNDSGPDSLRQAILDANADTTPGVVDTIKFKSGLAGKTITLTSGEIIISDDLNILGPAGPRVRIDGNNNDRIFHVNNISLFNVTLSRLQLQNGNTAGDGGAILNDTGANLTILNSVLTGNDAAGGGGALYANGGTIIIRNSNFGGATPALANTAAIAGGAIHLKQPDHSVLIENSKITGNTTGAIGAGGGLFLDYLDQGNVLSIHKSTISDNTAGISGGGGIAVVGDASVRVTLSKIQDNTANVGGGIHFRGDRAGDLVTIDRSSVSGNTASNGRGGGIYMASNEFSLAVLGSTFSGNSALGAGGAGGGIGIRYAGSMHGDVVIDSSTISNNSAGGDGGGIAFYAQASATGAFTISNSTISGNNSAGDGGGVSLGAGVDISVPVQILKTKITLNEAAGDGGGLSLSGPVFRSPVRIESSTISGNIAGDDGGGLALYADTGFYGGVVIRRTTIANNTATDDGGGLWFYDRLSDVNTLIENSTISGNSVGDAGGGIFFYAPDAGLILRNSTVSGNTAGRGGGFFIEYSGQDSRFENSTIAFNTAAYEGGGIYHDNGNLNLRSTIVARNTSLANDGNDLAGRTGATINAFFALIGNSTLGGLNPPALDTTPGFNILDVNPRLNPLASNGGPTKTHALKDTSPAINRGFNFSGSPFDQRGKPRTKGAGTDIGAVEQR